MTSPAFIEHHAAKTYGGVEVWFQAFLFSTLEVGQLHAPTAWISGKDLPVLTWQRA
jgi:hypothetical protein